MIRFFRNIRQAIIGQNRLGKYLFYAIGEIILVMIGILLALQVNNWNEERKLRVEHRRILIDLKSELNQNKNVIQECLARLKENQLYTDSIRTVLKPEPSNIAIDTINYWLGRAIGEIQTCEIETDVLQSIRSSGDLNILENESIKRGISRWTSMLNKLDKETSSWENEFSSIYGPYTMKYVSWDDIDKLFNPKDSRYFNSRFDKDPRLILQQFEFSNIIAFHYWRQENIVRQLQRLQEHTQDLSNLISNNIEN